MGPSIAVLSPSVPSKTTVCCDTLVVSHAAGKKLTQLSANETLALGLGGHEKISGVTFRDKEECGVEGSLDRRAGVDHPRLVDPLEGALLRVPLHGVEGVVVGWHTQEPQETFSHRTSSATTAFMQHLLLIVMLKTTHNTHGRQVRSYSEVNLRASR